MSWKATSLSCLSAGVYFPSSSSSEESQQTHVKADSFGAWKRENMNYIHTIVLSSHCRLSFYLRVTHWCWWVQGFTLNVPKNNDNHISIPVWATLSAWKNLAWNEIWVLRMLSRRSNSNTPIPSMQQQRDALLIIFISCIDSKRVGGSYKWVESRRSLFSGC